MTFRLSNSLENKNSSFKTWLRRDRVAMLRAGGAESNGWFFSTELLTIAEWNSLKIKELPVKWTDDVTESKVNIPRLAKQYLRAMAVLKAKRP